MAEKKKKCPPVGAPAWMCTFSDMMSLLLCFFILLLSFATMDATKFEEAAGSLQNAFGSQRLQPMLGTPMGQNMIAKEFPGQPIDLTVQVQIVQSLAEELKEGMLDVEEDADGITLRVKESVAFDSGRAVIKPRFMEILDKLGKTVSSMEVTVVVSGHTDNTPTKKETGYASNWGLSTARAVNVIDYWLTKYKIPATRLAAMGYAEGQPLASNSTEEGRASNRRVEFKIKAIGGGPVTEGVKSIVQPTPSVTQPVTQGIGSGGEQPGAATP
ncbi:MAG: OmpA family protein [Desulfobulbaceae bacterium]|nr:OmpA family protein [Desulfobulbaceae bacterium]